MTIDGVIQNEVSDGDGFKYGGWFFPYADEVTGAVAQERLAKPIDLLLGRKTFAARDICKGEVPWDAYVYVLDPDALAEEFASQQRRVL